jgi:hypothetical protein
VEAVEHGDVLLETSVAVAQKVVELLAPTVTGIPGEAKATALPVALVLEQLEFV